MIVDILNNTNIFQCFVKLCLSVEIEQDHTSSNGHTKSSENGVPEPVG